MCHPSLLSSSVSECTCHECGYFFRQGVNFINTNGKLKAEED